MKPVQVIPPSEAADGNEHTIVQGPNARVDVIRNKVNVSVFVEFANGQDLCLDLSDDGSIVVNDITFINATSKHPWRQTFVERTEAELAEATLSFLLPNTEQ